MKLAYLVSQYPAPSHTFIRREVEALRRRGADVQTFSVRHPAPDELRAEVDRRERDQTFYLLPARPVRLLAAHVRFLWRRPEAYLRTWGLALRHRTSGAGAAMWALFHFAEAVLLAAELERRGIGHLHNHFANAGGTVGLLATSLLGISWSVTLHGRADFDSPERILLREKLAHARFAICVAEWGREQALRYADPDDCARIFVARCGLDRSELPDRAKRLEDARARVVCIGRLSPEKGHIGLVEAFAGVVESGIDAELRLLGEGPERGRILARIEGLGLGDRCELPGHVTEEEALRELAEAEVFALSSLMEGLPVTLIEAMALGVPVVAPDLSGIPEVVHDDGTGLLFPPGDWEGLARCLLRLLRDAELRSRLAEAGRLEVAAAYDVDRAIEPLWQQFSALDRA